MLSHLSPFWELQLIRSLKLKIGMECTMTQEGLTSAVSVTDGRNVVVWTVS